MRTQHGGAHPSDRLLHGPVDGFEEALDLVEAQFAYERGVLLRSEPGPTARARWDEAHSQVQAATRAARRVWQEEQEAARLRAVERLREDALAAEAALDDEASRWLGRPRHGARRWRRRGFGDLSREGIMRRAKLVGRVCDPHLSVTGPWRTVYYAFQAQSALECDGCHGPIVDGELFSRPEINQRTQRFSRVYYCRRCVPFTQVQP